MSKQHYTDENGENVIHMYTPFALDIDDGYDYRRKGPLSTAWFYIIHTFVISILYPSFLIVNGLRIHGRKNMRALRGRGAVTVCNHFHVLDSPMVSCGIGLRRTYYVTLASNFCIPVIRHLVRWLGGVPLGQSPAQIKRMFSEMETALREGKIVQMYPEGVLIPYSDGLRAFRRGTFLMAAEAGVPVLPMVFTYRAPRGILRRLRRRPFLTLEILPAIFPDESLPMHRRSQRLLDDCRAAMLAAVDRSHAASENSARKKAAESVPVSAGAAVETPSDKAPEHVGV